MRILVAGWDSGGGTEVVATVVAKAVRRGHQVRVLGTAGLRDRFEAAGAEFALYRYAPDNDTSSPDTDLVKDFQARTPLGAFARVRDQVMFGPARQFCRDVMSELDRWPADVVLVDTLIPAAAFGAQAAGVPAVLLMHGPYLLPRRDAPPLGTGFRPAKGLPGRLRDRAAGALAIGLFNSAMPPVNQARAEIGLAPLRSSLDVAAAADRILVCTSPSFDFAAESVPPNCRYVGPQLDDVPSGRWRDPWSGSGHRPLVLVSLSSTVMRHELALLQRAARALGDMDVHGLISTGPAIDPATVTAPPNVIVRRWMRHADVLPHCAAVLSHGGHGTVMKALTGGVPLVVVPLGRDQPDNAARVVHAGAGLRLRKSASQGDLSKALRAVLDDRRYRDAARSVAAALAAEKSPDLVIEEIERIAAAGRPDGSQAVPPTETYPESP
jgi:MGT family glycosyltransferase